MHILPRNVLPAALPRAPAGQAGATGHLRLVETYGRGGGGTGGGGWGRRQLVETTHVCAELQGAWHRSESQLKVESSKAGNNLKDRRKTDGGSHLEAQEIGCSYKS